MNAEEDGTKRIVQTINCILGEEALPDERLERTFNTYWHCLEEDLKKIREGTPVATKPMRPQSDMIEAILITVREHSRILSNLAPQFNTRSMAPSCGDVKSIIYDLDNPVVEALSSGGSLTFEEHQESTELLTIRLRTFFTLLHRGMVDMNSYYNKYYLAIYFVDMPKASIRKSPFDFD